MTDVKKPIDIDVRGLVKKFGDVTALDGVSLSAERGTVLGLLGHNGSGKTTTISILSTLIRADSGTARLAGCDVAKDPAGVREKISLTGQYAALDELQTVRENLILFGRLTGLDKAAAQKRAEELAELLDLGELLDRRTGKLSGGQRRRADIAAALVTRPQVLFLDEPTTGLDPRSRAAVWDVVRSLREEGVTVLLTTQYLEEADRLADRIVILSRGRVIAEGTPAELKEKVGGSIVEIAVDADATEEVLASIEAPAAHSPEAGVIHVPAPKGTADLAAIASRLGDAGIVPRNIGLRRPTLDEVFLHLTGTDVKEEAPCSSAS